jgi:hypothetical protein
MTRWFDLLSFGSKEPSPRWGGHKDRISFNPFPLSNGHLDRVSLLPWLPGSLRPRKDHQTTVRDGCCRWAHRTVWCASHVTQPLGFWRSRPLKRWLLVAPDRHYSLSGAPLTSSANCSAVRGTVQLTVALASRCFAGAPGSPVNYSGATLEKPEGGNFGVWKSPRGGVNRANLKFTNFKHNYKLGLALEV